MSNNSKSYQKVETSIAAAIKKVGARKENDICRYLPGPKGGYIHHFSMRKMKHENPDQLLQLLDDNILNPTNPKKLPPKPRAPRGSRKRRDHLPLSKQDIDLLLQLAVQSGQKEIIRKLAPTKNFRTIQRELIQTIKNSEVREDLWRYYAEACAAQFATKGQPTLSATVA